jgi:hypothetical protein
MTHPNSPRYEHWLNEAASTFKDPERVKRALACFLEELRREEDEPEPAPIDPQYKREFMEQMAGAAPLAINRIKANIDRHLKVGGNDTA